MNVLRGADKMTNRTTPQRCGAIFKLLLIGIFSWFFFLNIQQGTIKQVRKESFLSEHL